MQNLQLIAATSNDLNTIIAWLPTEAAMVQALGPGYQFPLTAAQLLSLLSEKGRACYALINTDIMAMVGYGELVYNNHTTRLCHLLIAPPHRNKGLGTHMVQELVRTAKLSSPLGKIDLHVFAWNSSAIHCYQKQGFEIDKVQTTFCKVGNENWERLKMLLPADKTA